MSEKFHAYLCNYLRDRVGVFKKYLLAALDNKDQCIFYLESSEGNLVPSADMKNCEFLRGAQIFREDMRLSRRGRNVYKYYYLTELGKQFAEELKKESVLEEDGQPSS